MVKAFPVGGRSSADIVDQSYTTVDHVPAYTVIAQKRNGSSTVRSFALLIAANGFGYGITGIVADGDATVDPEISAILGSFRFYRNPTTARSFKHKAKP